jgi:hypothetical protein
MRPAADEPGRAEIAATLEVIDATLAGEPVDPGDAEVAELALLLADERPKPADEFARELDRRVESRFGAASKPAAKAKRRRSWRWSLAPAAGLAALAGIVVLIASAPGGVSSSGSSVMSAHAGLHGQSEKSRAMLPPARLNAKPTAAAPNPGLQAPQNGRQLIQSSQLALGARPNRIETVAQEALNVIGAQDGFVDSATVNAAGGTSGYARLQLTVPSATLPQTMTSLSRLPYATVISRMDKVEDVTGQLQSAKRHHQKARVRALEHGVAFSKISLTVQADAPSSGQAHHSHGGGFTLGRAAHDALGVLTVIGGIALIALAVLVPLAAVVALAWQLRSWIRRHQRERALDLA